MSAKAKSAKQKGEAETLESRLSEAIQMLSTKNANEATPLFESIAKEATEAGNYGLARVANSYFASRQPKKVAPAIKADPIQEAVFLLNANQPEVALEKIEALLKTQKTNAHAHYLKALALAVTEQPELSAESLKTAIEIDPAILHIYRLEPDFKECRKLSCFEEFELE
ncbi:MAG: hypothetical protein FWG02_06505 [Holophagaceae bacterium]|nr:hypothetical protein [Holophagaceae bacterium]